LSPSKKSVYPPPPRLFWGGLFFRLNSERYSPSSNYFIIRTKYFSQTKSLMFLNLVSIKKEAYYEI